MSIAAWQGCFIFVLLCPWLFKDILSRRQQAFIFQIPFLLLTNVVWISQGHMHETMVVDFGLPVGLFLAHRTIRKRREQHPEAN